MLSGGGLEGHIGQGEGGDLRKHKQDKAVASGAHFLVKMVSADMILGLPGYPGAPQCRREARSSCLGAWAVAQRPRKDTRVHLQTDQLKAGQDLPGGNGSWGQACRILATTFL